MYYEILGFMWLFFMCVCIKNFSQTELDFEVDYRKGKSYENWK